MEPIIETRDLCCTYSIGTPFEHKALDTVNFTAYPGEYIGIIGHTGSGKSTLIQHLNGLLKPTAGQVLLEGKDIWSDKKLTRQARFKVGLVFQYPEYQLFEETVYKDIAFGPKNMQLEPVEVDRRVRESATFVGLTEAQLEKSPFELSGGQKRRVAIAGVIAMEPEVLILDEPTPGWIPWGGGYSGKRSMPITGQKMPPLSLSPTLWRRWPARYNGWLSLTTGSFRWTAHLMTVFFPRKELIDMGLGIPQVTQVFSASERAGTADSGRRLYAGGSQGGTACPGEKGWEAMLKDITLGQYFPGNSVIHRMDPRSKLIIVILYIVVLFLAKSTSVSPPTSRSRCMMS